ncbi:uncharacterized protein MONOS_5789 [Monocercomonoides exilis]|uniref:uncharacterized protein n=1 Tax=Monocercomonoides exilis TaxID=2049356 RepID=UPI00355A57B9|nr:hypothetical protein MONOS_5789 [Monocercomonoides exilis]|eukprot:MONOS_5789.1-p1 / transcript=MONOS_5789.1 / gene=MONOS_5789 / organism=Monocercomonoides_exilis_PA203 / gene_product=unspecified product / transcript_product=unspecified product / location=Mono_scaffold00173:62742-64769(-) / protein_length=676 / sequence_SO=supercontig / SO=protein_coding / is_pseudo=false
MLYVLTSRFLIESADTLSQAKTSKKQQETNSSVRDISSKDSTEILNKEGNVRITKMQVQEGGTLVTRYFVESFASYLEVIGTRLLSIPIRRYLQMSDSPLTVEEYKISKGASAKLNEEEAFHFGLPLKGSQKIITVSDRIGCLMRELLAYFETKREEIEASNLILKVKVNDMWRSFISGEKIEEEAKKEVHMKGKYIKSLRLLLTSVYTLLFSSFGPLVGSALHLIGSMLGTAGVQVSVCLIKWFGAFRDSLQIELAKKLMSFSKNEEQKNENVCIQREETAKDTLLLYVLQQNGRIWTDTKSHSALQENAGVLMGQLINAFAPTSVLRLAGVSALRHATAGSEIVEKLLQYFLEYCIGNGRLGEVLKVIGSIQPIRISQSTGGGTKGNDNLSVVKVHSPLTPFSRELSEMLCSLPRRSSSRSIGEASLMDAIEVLGWCCENFTFTLAEHLFRPTIFSFAIYVALSVDTPVHSWLLGLECEECENLSSEFKLQELQKEKKKRKTPVKIVLEMIKLLVMVGKEKPEIVSWVREEAISRLPGFALKVLGLFSAEIRMTEHEGIFDKGKEKYLVLSLDLLRIMLDCLKEVGVFLEEVTTGRIILPKSCPPAESFVGLQMPEKGKGEYGTVVMGSSSIIGRALKTFVSEASFHDVGKEIFHSANSLCKTFEALRFRNKK